MLPPVQHPRRQQQRGLAHGVGTVPGAAESHSSLSQIAAAIAVSGAATRGIPAKGASAVPTRQTAVLRAGALSAQVDGPVGHHQASAQDHQNDIGRATAVSPKLQHVKAGKQSGMRRGSVHVESVSGKAHSMAVGRASSMVALARDVNASHSATAASQPGVGGSDVDVRRESEASAHGGDDLFRETDHAPDASASVARKLPPVQSLDRRHMRAAARARISDRRSRHPPLQEVNASMLTAGLHAPQMVGDGDDVSCAAFSLEQGAHHHQASASCADLEREDQPSFAWGPLQ